MKARCALASIALWVIACGPRREVISLPDAFAPDAFAPDAFVLDAFSNDTNEPMAFRMCEEALRLRVNGSPCDFAGMPRCTTYDADTCCTETMTCDLGRTRYERTCTTCPPPSTCLRDRDCMLSQICVGGHCEACPMTSCPPCTIAGFEPIARNGCRTCTCAPPSTCRVEMDACGAGLSCLQGSLCAADCNAMRDPTCCTQQCADAACRDLQHPAGCAMDCPPPVAMAGCAQCVASACRCDPSRRWTCEAVCNPTMTTPSCHVPP